MHTNAERQHLRALGTSYSALRTLATALRRFRLPVPARVQVQDGRPVRVTTDRRGVTGGADLQAAGPWRTSGEWWNDGSVPGAASCTVAHLGAGSPSISALRTAPHPSGTDRTRRTAPHPSCWDRDEWDVAVADGTVYRLFVERDVGQWFLEGVVD